MRFKPVDVIIEHAQLEEVKPCMRIIADARYFQQECGFTQWTAEYPNTAILQEDIHKQRGYVLKVKGKIAGYLCIDFEGEPAYANITEGSWATSEKYAVVHRMAISEEFRNAGMTYIAFALIEKICLENGMESIRVDTQAENKRMQHILNKLNFTKRGIINFEGPKLAYDKPLK